MESFSSVLACLSVWLDFVAFNTKLFSCLNLKLLIERHTNRRPYTYVGKKLPLSLMWCLLLCVLLLLRCYTINDLLQLHDIISESWQFSEERQFSCTLGSFKIKVKNVKCFRSIRLRKDKPSEHPSSYSLANLTVRFNYKNDNDIT